MLTEETCAHMIAAIRHKDAKSMVKSKNIPNETNAKCVQIAPALLTGLVSVPCCAILISHSRSIPFKPQINLNTLK